MKTFTRFVLACAAVLAGAASSVQGKMCVRLRSDYIGGNGKLEMVDEGTRTIIVSKETKGSEPGTAENVYFNFELSGLEGKWEVHILSKEGVALTRMGPTVSVDGGKTWKFLYEKPVAEDAWTDEFMYDFPKGGAGVRFCLSYPYGEKEWKEFAAEYATNEWVRMGELCKDRSGRGVERFDVMGGGEKAAWTFVFTARHHACEVSGSPVLEGILQACLEETAEGRWVRENAHVIAIPFMDQDGVRDGDQGKKRLLHDHNRDYKIGLYPSVRALKEAVPEEGTKVCFVDLHSPWLRGWVHDQIHTLRPEGEEMDARYRAYAKELEGLTKGAALVYEAKWDLPYGHYWNNTKLFEGADGTLVASPRYFWHRANCYLSMCVEYGYGLCGGIFSREAAQELGRNTLKALVRSIEKAKVASRSLE